MSFKMFKVLSLVFAGCLVSCEDKEKVAQHAEQSRQILILREELTSLKEQLDDRLVQDPSAKLEETERMIEEKKGVLSDFEEELSQIKSDRKEAGESFSRYKERYLIEG